MLMFKHYTTQIFLFFGETCANTSACVIMSSTLTTCRLLHQPALVCHCFKTISSEYCQIPFCGHTVTPQHLVSMWACHSDTRKAPNQSMSLISFSLVFLDRQHNSSIGIDGRGLCRIWTKNTCDCAQCTDRENIHVSLRVKGAFRNYVIMKSWVFDPPPLIK